MIMLVIYFCSPFYGFAWGMNVSNCVLIVTNIFGCQTWLDKPQFFQLICVNRYLIRLHPFL